MTFTNRRTAESGSEGTRQIGDITRPVSDGPPRPRACINNWLTPDTDLHCAGHSGAVTYHHHCRLVHQCGQNTNIPSYIHICYYVDIHVVLLHPNRDSIFCHWCYWFVFMCSRFVSVVHTSCSRAWVSIAFSASKEPNEMFRCSWSGRVDQRFLALKDNICVCSPTSQNLSSAIRNRDLNEGTEGRQWALQPLPLATLEGGGDI